MDIRKIKKLVEILEESGLAEIEIHEQEESIRLSRYSSELPVATMPAGPAPAQMALPPSPVAPALAVTDAAGDDAELEDGYVIRAPMVGTFYGSPNPESDPFVRVGQSIKAGDVVCIIEAMKMFNQIESEVDGKVVAVLVDNAQPIEFDQPLFIVR
jgi:acetyl-CoA carboxylase biotin carboxyl carrier protein